MFQVGQIGPLRAKTCPWDPYPSCKKEPIPASPIDRLPECFVISFISDSFSHFHFDRNNTHIVAPIGPRIITSKPQCNFGQIHPLRISLMVQILTQPLIKVAGDVVLFQQTLASSKQRASSCTTTTPNAIGGPGFGFLISPCTSAPARQRASRVGGQNVKNQPET